MGLPLLLALLAAWATPAQAARIKAAPGFKPSFAIHSALAPRPSASAPSLGSANAFRLSPSLSIAPAPRLEAAAFAPSPLLLPARAEEFSGRAAPAGSEDRELRSELTASVWERWEGLESARENNDFARRHGIRILLTPFDSQTLLGLDPDNLAQYEPEDRLIHLNWSMAGPDLSALLRRGGRAEALALAGLALAPIASHEARHGRLRSEFGEDFPPVREEEILAHADQAAAFDELLRAEPVAGRLEIFLVRHSRALWERWREGFPSLARYALARNRAMPSLADDAAANARAIEARLAEFRAAPDSYPPVWITRAERALAFWENPASLRRLADYLSGRLRESAAAFERAAPLRTR